MSKSIFSTWSKLAREALADSGCKLSHGQSMEVLAAGLGHNTYASLRLQDEDSLEAARFVVLSFEAMQARALSMDRAIQSRQCEIVLNKIDSYGDRGLMRRRLQRLGVFDTVPTQSVDLNSAPAVAALAEAEGLKSQGATILWAECRQPFSLQSLSWEWTVYGQIIASSSSDDFEIPFSAQVSFDKCGRHLMSEGQVLTVSSRGRPSVADDGAFEGYVSESDL